MSFFSERKRNSSFGSKKYGQIANQHYYFPTFGIVQYKRFMEIIGRKDVVSFPVFGLESVPVKIDSGAYSSSIHCSSVRLIHGDIDVLEVVFLDAETPGYTGKKELFTDFSKKTVKSSNGVVQERFFIKGSIELFGINYETVFSLTERSGLKNPVLLGRRLLNKRFLIDTSKVNLSKKYN